MQEISSKEYANLISKTVNDNVATGIIGNFEKQLNDAYKAGIVDATKQFLTNYKNIKDEFSANQAGMTFEALDYLFNSVASLLMEEVKNG